MVFFSRKVPATQIREFVINDKVLPVEVRENPRAKRLIMRLNKTGDGLKLSVPPGTDARRTNEFIDNHQDWIVKELQQRPVIERPSPDKFIPIFGKAHRIVHHDGRGTSHIRDNCKLDSMRTIADNIPIVESQLHIFGRREHLQRRVADFLKRTARKELETLSLEYAARLNLKPTRIQIKDTISRWGSCSSNGTLSYSWRIIMAPRDVLEYLAAHEVSHLKEMNHGPNFWQTVAVLCPEYKLQRDWLKQQGRSLHSWQFD